MIFKNKKGTLRDLVFLAGIGFFAIASIILVVHYIAITLFGTLLAEDAFNAADDVLNAGTNTYNKLDFVGVVFFIATLLTFIIGSWFTSGHPILMPIYFIGGIGAVLVSMFVSNLWEDFTAPSVFTGTIAALPFTNWMMLQLPVVIGAFYFIGIIITFAKPRQGGDGL